MRSNLRLNLSIRFSVSLLTIELQGQVKRADTSPRIGETDGAKIRRQRVPHTCTTHCVENLVLARGDAINVSELINRHATERKESPVAVSKGSAPDIRQTNVNSRSILPSHPSCLPSLPDATTQRLIHTVTRVYEAAYAYTRMDGCRRGERRRRGDRPVITNAHPYFRRRGRVYEVKRKIGLVNFAL